jgi:hypothetical protein
MRVGLWLGLLAVGLLVQSSHGQTPSGKLKPAGNGQAVVAKNTVPEPLEALNRATRKLYARGRALELATIPAVIIVSGDDLILRKNGKRQVATVIPAEYHALKSIAHSMLGLFAHLSYQTGKPLGEERLKALTEYRDLLVAAGQAVEGCGFDADALARQKRIISRGVEFIDAVLKDGKVSESDLVRYCRMSRPDLMANAAAAVRAQLAVTHRQVMEWKKDMTPQEWESLTAIVLGMQTPRQENAAVQYFARLFGESSGEGRRVVYAEGLDETKAMNLLGTLRLDGKLSVAVFNDRFRMYRDLVADVARSAIDDILGTSP